VLHFVRPEFYLAIMPLYLPWHRALVFLSGVAEVAFGALMFVRPRIGAWGLIATLIAVFPANLHMALNPQLFPEFPPLALWLRLPIQGVLLAWAWWHTRD